jgi:hypothetical protein
MRGRLIGALLVSAITWWAFAPAASADLRNGDERQAEGSLLGDGSGATVSVGHGAHDEDTPAGTGKSKVVCRYYYDATGEPVDFNDIQPYDVYRDCTDRDTGAYVSSDVITLQPRNPAALAAEAMEVARQDLALPLPGVRTNPPPDHDLLVRVPVWLWLDGEWATLSATAGAGPVSATVSATPQSVEWVMGDGETVTCLGPGTPYDVDRPSNEQSTDCSHTYHRSSAGQPGERFTVTATVVWRVAWTSSIGAGGQLGEVRRSQTFQVRVAEAQAVGQ